jgi:hypothetical protein
MARRFVTVAAAVAMAFASAVPAASAAMAEKKNTDLGGCRLFAMVHAGEFRDSRTVSNQTSLNAYLYLRKTKNKALRQILKQHPISDAAIREWCLDRFPKDKTVQSWPDVSLAP